MSFSSLFAFREAGPCRRDGAALLFSAALGIAAGAAGLKRFSMEAQLQGTRVERSEAAGAIRLANNQHQATDESAVAREIAAGPAKSEVQTAAVIRLAEQYRLQMLGTDVQGEPGDLAGFTMDVRVRGPYPALKQLIADALEANDQLLIRTLSARRLGTTGTDVEARIVFGLTFPRQP